MGGRPLTFLFTDIEGSTRLWDESPGTMGPALARHDEIVRTAIHAHGGRVFKSLGDAFYAAFDAAPAAVAAAADAQRALAAEEWPTPRPVRVRMAIHAGEVEARDGDYFGPPLNRVARLLVLGHGGQTLLSASAQKSARDALPEGAELAPLGEHRLRDLAEPETVFGLIGPGLPRDFPPLRSLAPPRKGNLPAGTTSFVGRGAELREIAETLDRSRVLTLLGPGGTGKTRLALRAAEARSDLPGGAWFVDLSPLTDPALVPSVLAEAMAVPETEGRSLEAALTEGLREAPALIVLDNCEHLIDAAARLAYTLIRAVPDLRIVATSREPLGIVGETLLRVPPLSLPEGGTAEAIDRSEAARLFVERATAQRGDFAVTPANAPAVASLCRRLDDLPLALELAAARVRSLGVEDIEARLDDRFRLLTGGARTALPRQQSLRALVDWSYELLDESERTTLRRLAVFAGGWTLSAAEAVVAGTNVAERQVLEGLACLVDKSLVTFDEERYGMLHTVRHYALERLREAGEEAATVERHADHFEALAQTEGPRTRDHADAMRRLALETDNLRAAMDRGTRAQRLEMVGALRRFWVMRGMAREARDRALVALREDDPPTGDARRVRAIATACALGGWASEGTAVMDLVREGIALAERIGEDETHMTLLNELGSVLKAEGDLQGARGAFEEAARVKPGFAPIGNLAIVLTLMGEFGRAEAEIARSEGHLRVEGGGESPYFRCFARFMRVRLAYAQGRVEEAEAETRRLFGVAEDLGSASVMQEAWSMLCDCCLAQGRFEEAEAIARRMAAEAGGGAGLEPALIQLAQAATGRGEFAEAEAALRACLRSVRPLFLPSGLEAAARIFDATGGCHEAAVLLGAASVVRGRGPMPLTPMEIPDHERLLARLRRALGEEAFVAATDEGEALDGETAKAYALETLTFAEDRRR